MFLSDDELKALSDCKRPSDQIRWLTALRIPFVVSAKGKVKVLRRVVEIHLQGNVNVAAPKVRLA